MRFDRYYGESSIEIPRKQLSVPTRRNLRYLEEELGYQFDNQAREARFGWAPSYLISGIDPQGDEVIYERRETGGRGAGQTYLWKEGKRRRLYDLGIPDLSVAGAEKRWMEDLVREGEEEVDFEGLGEDERLKLKEVMRRILEEHLTEEDKKRLKEFLKDYKENLD